MVAFTPGLQMVRFPQSMELLIGLIRKSFACKDGFRWSPNIKSIAYWQIDASAIKKFYMVNNTEAIYSQLIPLKYPKFGETPSSCKVGVVELSNAKTTWINIPMDSSNNYLVRMEFIPTTNNLLIQQLNRKQKLLIYCSCF